jgi:two-component system, OmpR family, response regulator MtrA
MVTPKRVLVVDDEPGIVKVLGIKLKLCGFEVVGTTSGAEAVELARERQPDVMLLDILMPGMSGMEVLERVRTFSDVPVIVFTARPDITQIAVQMGADDAIAKPFDPDQMVEKIRSVLSGDGRKKSGARRRPAA